jgi:eukaryotic-like serine/threonine-protein kinase
MSAREYPADAPTTPSDANRGDALLDAAGRIVDGAEVEWSRLGEDLPPAVVERLRQIQILAGGFQASPAEAQPSRFAHLQVLEPLGQGGGGAVFRAFDPLLQRSVALKLLAAGREGAGVQLREAQRLASVQHPNVLKVHGAAVEDGVVGFWTDLAEGESLQSWIASHPRPGAHEVAALGRELCAALAAIHAAGLTHGDLKPGNVMRDGSGRWILIDFGSCVARGEPDSSGTPLYLAPERFGSGAVPTPAVDIYSLGVLLFRWASDRHPVEAEDSDGLIRAHVAGQRHRLLDLRPDLPEWLRDAIETALERDPARRHASVGAFAAALGAAPATTSEPRRRLPLLAALLAILLVVLLWPLLRPASPTAPDLRLVRSSLEGETVLRNGDRVMPGDALALHFRHSRPAWVYVLNEDAMGDSFQLFPLAGAELVNPLPAGRDLRLPGRVAGAELDWQITSRGQRERLLVLVSDVAVPEIEQRLLAQAELGRRIEPGSWLAAAPERGVGGLGQRPEVSASELERWIGELQQRYPALDVQRFDLVNP